MKEITPALVVEAIKKGDLQPVYRSWGDGKTCACALTALAAADGKKLGFLRSLTSDLDEMKYFAKTFGYSVGEIHSFVNGYDQMPLPPAYGKPEEKRMYELGQECFVAVKAEFQDRMIDPN